MNWALLFFASTSLCIIFILYLYAKLFRVQEQLSVIKDALNDIQNGNLNRRILTRKTDQTRSICYAINEIAAHNQSQFIRLKQSEQSYKQLMTSLSHDVKTPLTSLVGYLEAIKGEFVIGKEKDEYITVALSKSYQLKDFVESLFEWVKLDAKEQTFQFEIWDITELSRDILADWIPAFEEKQFAYKIDIPNSECLVRLDRNAYIRVMNNLFQNALLHSKGDQIFFEVSETGNQVLILLADNGIGITEKDLPHIFERLYQCDESRCALGNGLGLSIVYELLTAHGSTIRANCLPDGGTQFEIKFSKALP